jgi:uncharacterized membrane protein
LIYFAIPAALAYYEKNKTIKNALYASFRYAGLLGFFAYGIYSFTCLAIFKAYTWTIALKDAVWGGMLFTLVCLLYLCIF